MGIIKFENIVKRYGRGECEVLALNEINIDIEDGEMVAIVGSSGSGKSTLLNIIGTLDRQDNGEYFLYQKNINSINKKELYKLRNECFGFVVQNFALVNDYTVFENIEIPLEYAKIKRREREGLIDCVLKKLGIYDKKNKKITTLSGGQSQRVAIARAIVNNPKIILADEPTGALDSKTGQQVIDIFKMLNKEGKTIIIVTHDISIANQCDRIIKIEDGKLV